MALWIMDSGATTEEIERGVAAAQSVFAEYGVTADDAAEAKREIDAHDEAAGGSISTQTTMRAIAWDAAERAAINACCAGWRHVPDEAYLDAGQ